MRVMIMGCGRLGAELAHYLSVERHSVVVIDRDASAFHRLRPGFTGDTVEGFGFDRDILSRSGIEETDAFVAVTASDSANIVGALTAKQRFRVPKVVARIYDPKRALIYRRLGVPTVATTAWASHKMRELILFPEFHPEHSFGSGEVEMTRVPIPPLLAGKPVESIEVPGRIRVVAITRLGESLIPVPGNTFSDGDVARIAVAKPALGQFQRLLGGG